MLWTHSLAILAGFSLLVWGADRFVAGAASTARLLGVSPLIIGLTIVGFGTSAPEMLVSATAAWAGNSGIAIGNALGSNITNIGLVLGISALIAPLTLQRKTLLREFPVLFAIMALTLLLMLDGHLSRLDGIILLSGFVLMIYWLVRRGIVEHGCDTEGKNCTEDEEFEIPENMGAGKATFWIIAGLALLLVSSRLLIWGAVGIAEHFAVSDLVIGLTIVAIGTSLPELAASVTSAIRGEHDIAIGNVLGSNMFNLLAVLGLPGLIHPLHTPTGVLSRDFPVMFGLTALLFLFAFGRNAHHRLARPAGGILLVCFVAYLGLLFHVSK